MHKTPLYRNIFAIFFLLAIIATSAKAQEPVFENPDTWDSCPAEFQFQEKSPYSGSVLGALEEAVDRKYRNALKQTQDKYILAVRFNKRVLLKSGAKITERSTADRAQFIQARIFDFNGWKGYKITHTYEASLRNIPEGTVLIVKNAQLFLGERNSGNFQWIPTQLDFEFDPTQQKEIQELKLSIASSRTFNQKKLHHDPYGYVSIPNGIKMRQVRRILPLDILCWHKAKTPREKMDPTDPYYHRPKPQDIDE